MQRLKLLLTAIAAFSVQISMAQNCIAVESEKMNVLYVGVDNTFRLVANDVPDSNLVLSPSMGKIEKIADCKYLWSICNFDTTTATLMIGSKNENHADTLHFRVKRAPEPIALLGRGPNHSITAGGVVLVLQNFDFELKADVVRYEIIILRKNQDPLVLQNTGIRFNEKARTIFESFKPGDKVIFQKFVYRYGCDPQLLRSSQKLVYTIK